MGAHLRRRSPRPRDRDRQPRRRGRRRLSPASRARGAPARAAIALACAALAAAAAPASAQRDDDALRGLDRELPSWAGDAVFLAGNALIGGVTAGLIRELRGGSFREAFLTGSLGGGVAYAGRRVAVERFAGAGLVGRQVAAVGGSFVGNAAGGRALAAELALPLWLVRVHVGSDRPGGPLRARVKADLPTLLATAWYAAGGDARLDLGASLSSGLPVFEADVRGADGYWRGRQVAGVVRLEDNPADPNPDAARAAVLAHERVHVLQYDFGAQLWSEPAESWLAQRVPAGRWLHRHVELGLHLPAWAFANAALPYARRPWEHEAHFLSGISGER